LKKSVEGTCCQSKIVIYRNGKVDKNRMQRMSSEWGHDSRTGLLTQKLLVKLLALRFGRTGRLPAV
jgi:hypothetical protein